MGASLQTVVETPAYLAAVKGVLSDTERAKVVMELTRFGGHLTLCRESVWSLGRAWRGDTLTPDSCDTEVGNDETGNFNDETGNFEAGAEGH